MQIRHMDNSYISNVEFIRFAQETGISLESKYQDAVRRGGSTNAGKIQPHGKGGPSTGVRHSRPGMYTATIISARKKTWTPLSEWPGGGNTGLDEERIARILRKEVISD